LCVPAFMNVTMDLSRENVLHWEFKPGNCFAYKGIRRIGAIEKYECGVIHRLASWFDALGLRYRITPEVTACRMASGGACAGDFVFDFGDDRFEITPRFDCSGVRTHARGRSFRWRRILTGPPAGTAAGPF